MTDLPPRFVPGSTGLSTLRENQIKGLLYELIVHQRLAGAGYAVTNLNIDVLMNFPIADLVASNDRHRLLVQVRGGALDSNSFRIDDAEVKRLHGLARAIGHCGIYAFVFYEVGINFRTTREILRGQSGRCEYLDCENPYLVGEELAERLDELVAPERAHQPPSLCRHEHRWPSPWEVRPPSM